MRLQTDFRDFYDMAFPRESDRVFNRMAGDRSMSKSAQFSLLDSLGFSTPIRGLGKYLKSLTPLRDNDLIVIYTDDRAHGGEGKKFTSLGGMSAADRECLCSQWINTTGEFDKAQSYRLLQIGHRAWWLRYEGVGGWMSNNCCETEIYIEGECQDLKRSPKVDEFPLFAIDFVVPVNSRTPETVEELFTIGKAIDFNTAPGMRWTGMNDILQPADIYNLISDFA